MGYKVLVTGTPAVGKTTLSNYMGQILNYEVISLSDLIEEEKIFDRKCEIFDTLEYSPEEVERSLRRRMEKNKNYILDTHDPETVSFIRFDVVIVLAGDIKILGERYEKRGYSKIKSDENIQVEIMEVIYNEVIENICETEEEIEEIIKIETVKEKEVRTTEDIFREIQNSRTWKKVMGKDKQKDKQKRVPEK